MEITGNMFECHICGKTSSCLRRLREHISFVHKKERPPKAMDFAKFDENVMKFDSVEEFKDWKREVEREDDASFVVKTTRAMRNGKKIHYGCNRSGDRKPKTVAEDQRKRRRTSEGSSGVCTAKFIAHFFADQVVVSDFFRTHCCHGTELLTNLAPVKSEIATEIASEVTVEIDLYTKQSEMDSHVKCAVRTCSNHSKNSGDRIRYFRFPRDDDLLTLWTVRCDRIDTWTPSTSFVCSSHFTAHDYEEVTPGIFRLLPRAVPSQNLSFDWDNDDQADMMMMKMEEDFTSDDDENSDSNARAQMSISERGAAQISSTAALADHPSAEVSFPSNAHSSSTTQSMSNRTVSNATNDPNVIVVTDISKRRKPLKQVSYKKNRVKRNVNNFCCVPTCSAFKGHHDDKNGFHYFPSESTERQKWIRAIFHSEMYIRSSRFICRRHFTTDDYLKSPRSGALPRLRRGVVPSQNIPICESESLLARKKLWLDVFRWKPEDKNLTFAQQIAREPELQKLLQRFVQDALQIDPRRAEVVPFIPRRGFYKGCGEPVQVTGNVESAKLAKKAAKSSPETRKLRLKMKKAEQNQLREERKMRLSKEKLERLELRRSNSQAYHELLAEERLMQRQEELSERTAGGTIKFLPNRGENLSMTSAELKMLKESDPEAYSRLLPDSMAKQRREKLARKLTDVKHPARFSDKIEIVATDPEKGEKYKVVVKKVWTQKSDVGEDTVSQLTNNKEETIELVQNVIKEIDFSKTKRIKFAETEKLTKISELRSLGMDVQALGLNNNGPNSGGARPSTSKEDTEDVLADDDQQDQHLYDDRFDEINCSEGSYDGVADMDDHSYTSKTMRPDEELHPKDPFEELENQLQALPEDQARALVREKMDGYKDTFRKQMTRIRGLLQTKKKVDRKVKMLTRALCISLHEQYVKYYKN